MVYNEWHSLQFILCNVIELEENLIFGEEVLRNLVTYGYDCLEVLVVYVALLETSTESLHTSFLDLALRLLCRLNVYLELTEESCLV